MTNFMVRRKGGKWGVVGTAAVTANSTWLMSKQLVSKQLVSQQFLTHAPHAPFWAWAIRSLAGLVLLLALLLAAGCASTPKDETPTGTAERLYKDAREDMEAGSFDRAIKSLERVEGLAAGSVMAQQAVLDMAYLHWKTDDRVQALATVERFIKLNPSSPALDYALYLRGVINFNESLGLLGAIAAQDLSERDQRASRDSFQAFKQLLDQFPNSKYAADARLRMNYIVNSLASYEVHVARYYFRRGAYVAAAARAQQAVADFSVHRRWKKR